MVDEKKLMLDNHEYYVTRDEKDRVIHLKTVVNGKEYWFEYDDKNNMVHSHSDLIGTWYEYDEQNRLVRRIYDNGEGEYFTYDNNDMQCIPLKKSLKRKIIYKIKWLLKKGK